MNDTKIIFYLFMILEKLGLRSSKIGFSGLKDWTAEDKKRKKKLCLQSLGSNKGKIARVVLWMIKVGRINIQQRGFLRWKFNIFPIIKPARELYNNADRYAIVRSIVTVPKRFYWQLLLRYINKWKNWVFMRKSQEKLAKQRRVSLNLVLFVFQDKVSVWFEIWKDYCRRLKAFNLQIKYINRIFLRNLQNAFENFKFSGYYYEDYVIETVVKKDKVTKNFKIVHKPVTQLEYYDLKTYDPAFRAVCRNLGHFLKRRQGVFFRSWKRFTEAQKKSLASLKEFFQEKTNIEKFKLCAEKLRMLKKLLIQFCVIQEKICQMPENCIARWSEKAHIKALKEMKFKILVIRNQRQEQKKKIFFTDWKQSALYSQSFTDME